jgi:hypothetical protein
VSDQLGDLVDGESLYEGKYDIRKIYSTPVLALSIQRRSFKNEFLPPEELLDPENESLDETPVTPNERITLIDGSELILVGSIVYIEGMRHYTAVFRCENAWYTI